MDEQNNWRTKVMLIGGVIGALTGLGAAYVFIRRVELEEEPPKFTTGEGVRLGMLILGVLRQIGQIGSGE
jgi:hypothetical protein